MALDSTDLLVVQKAAGDKSNKALSISNLTTYISNQFDASAAVVYKGPGDMNDSAATPSTPSVGDLYINSDGDATGTFQWTQGASGADPNPSITQESRAIYNANGKWDVTTPGSGDVGVTAVKQSDPITVNNTDPAEPIIGITAAPLTTDAGTSTPSVTASFGVVAVASPTDVTNGSETAVATAAQLKVVSDALDAATAGGVTTVLADAPLAVVTDGTSVGGVATSTTKPGITVADATSATKGVVQLVDNAAVSSSATATTTALYVSSFYLIGDFTQLQEITV